ncbi:hypothetical protein [Staphylococcus nepalensis]|jgi:hypothetical protein|nr:hypothetical protein [Staphylococcus nepalensis]MBO1212172.1 hypothetical protein [Staphylococcus nepalensis]
MKSMKHSLLLWIGVLRIMHHIVTAIQKTDVSKSIKNLLLVIQLLGTLDIRIIKNFD